MPKVPSRVEIKESGSRMTKPWIVVGVPEVGLVGTIACSYLVEHLKLEPRGYVDSDLAPQVMIVRNSIPGYPIQIFGRGEMVVVLSEVPLSNRLSLELAKEISRWARARQARVVIGLSGEPSRKREESQGEEKPIVVGISNDGEMLKSLRSFGGLPLEQGYITGFYASLLKYCSLNEQTNLTLLGESMMQFPDPAAAASVIEVLGKVVPMKIDTRPLMKESEAIRLRTRELMQQTQQAQQAAPPSGEGPLAYR